MFGSHYSPTMVSNTTSTVLEDIEHWHKRPLKKRYAIIYLGGLYVKLKRSTVSGEAIYFAMGVDEEGHREILGFYIGGQESSNGWREVLKDLYKRGVQEVLLGVFDGLSEQEHAFVNPIPRPMYSTESCIKSVIPSRRFGCRKQLPTLLTFYTYPLVIKKAIYTSNPIEG